MENTTQLVDVLSAYVDQIEDQQLVRVCGKKFHETGLIIPDVHLGSGDAKDELKFQLRQHQEIISPGTVDKGISAYGQELINIHRRHQKKTDILYWGIFACILLTVLFLMSCSLLGIQWIPQTAAITALMAILVFPVYRTENKKLKTAEGNLQQLHTFKAQLDLVALIPDEAVRRAGYQKIIASLSSGDDLRHATLIQNFAPIDKQVNVDDQRGDIK